MRFSFWLRNWKRPAPTVRRRTQTSSRQRSFFRPRLEALEDRMVPAVFNVAAGDVYGSHGLIADINAANKTGGTNTINLAGGVYDLTAVNNTTNGANGLPVISGGGKKTAADNLTIIGSSGAIIQRDPALGPSVSFRLFDVASGGSLTLENVTLQSGLAFGSGAAADGGAIYNQGTLTLTGATVQGNTAQGSDGPGVVKIKNKFYVALAGADAEGGGIWSSGTVKLEGGTTIGGTLPSQVNEAQGGRGAPEQTAAQGAGAGGGGYGGGLYEAGGSVTMSDATLIGNQALGGAGHSKFGFAGNAGNGGAASGGGLFVASGTLVMSNDTVEYNMALGGNGGSGSGSGYLGDGGTGSGGGVYVGGGTVTLQTVQLLSNNAQGGEGGNYHFTEGVTLGAIEYDHGSGGSGLGGGLYVGGGAVTLTGDTVTGNTANAAWSGYLGAGGPGVAVGGGIDIASQAKVSLDSITVTNTTTNDDWLESPPGGYWVLLGEDDIDGSYTLT